MLACASWFATEALGNVELGDTGFYVSGSGLELNHIHHVHIFASDLSKSMEFYQKAFGGEVVLDATVAGARNVFMRIGRGRLHFYDQPPKYSGRGSIHHFGIQTDNLEEGYARLQGMGVPFTKAITDRGYMKYVMVPAPDNILIEYFQVDKQKIPPGLCEYFES
jgi:catechol 2,3-dioxygenase-like lactoylglutathione lyase family enzyme